MLNRLRDRFGAKVLAIGVATALLGGGVALALPDEAITGQETAAANQEAAEAKALTAQETAEANQAAAGLELSDLQQVSIEERDADDLPGDIPQVVRDHINNVWAYVTCIQEGARAHGEQQSNSLTREENAEFDVDEACPDKPVNLNDTEGELENELEGEGEGRPAFLGEGEGRPAFLGAEGEGPPAFAGAEGRP